jgi:hypothetical protein
MRIKLISKDVNSLGRKVKNRKRWDLEGYFKMAQISENFNPFALFVLRRGIKGFDRNIKAKSCGTFQHYQPSLILAKGKNLYKQLIEIPKASQNCEITLL